MCRCYKIDLYTVLLSAVNGEILLLPVRARHVENAYIIIRDVPNIRFVFASAPNSGPNSVFVFGR